MHSLTSSVSLLLLPLVAHASPLLNYKAVDTAFCKANDVVLRSLEKNVLAAPYCVSFLSIPTSTVTKTATVTPSSAHSTIPVTITTDAVTVTVPETTITVIQETATPVETHTEYTTTTVTSSTSTLSCLNSAYTYVAPTGVVPAQNKEEIKKRTVKAEKPKCMPSSWTAPKISKACSCLVLPTPKVTKTVTMTLPTGTITAYSTQVITPTDTATTIVIASTTTTTSVTSTETVTATVTAYATETTIASNGVTYRKYSHAFNANLVNTGFFSSFFKTQAPEFTGALTSLSFATPNWPNGNTQLKLQDRSTSFASDQSALVMHGFYIAKQTGLHTFISSQETVDNWAYMWVGDAAYSSWDDSNTAFKSSRTGAPYVSGRYQIQMNAGDAVPVMYLWANGGGVGQSRLQIQMPNGAVVTQHDGYFVQACSPRVFA